MQIKRLTGTILDRHLSENARADALQNAANIAYMAMMMDIDLDDDDELEVKNTEVE